MNKKTGMMLLGFAVVLSQMTPVYAAFWDKETEKTSSEAAISSAPAAEAEKKEETSAQKPAEKVQAAEPKSSEPSERLEPTAREKSEEMKKMQLEIDRIREQSNAIRSIQDMVKVSKAPRANGLSDVKKAKLIKDINAVTANSARVAEAKNVAQTKAAQEQAQKTQVRV